MSCLHAQEGDRACEAGERALEARPVAHLGLRVLGEEPLRVLVSHVVDTFEREVVPDLPLFRKGPIFADFNDANVLVATAGTAFPATAFSQP